MGSEFSDRWIGDFRVVGGTVRIEGQPALADVAFVDNEKPSPISDNALLDGLVAYFKLDEGTGTTAINSVLPTPPLDGTHKNGPVYTAEVPPSVTFTDPFSLRVSRPLNQGITIPSDYASELLPRDLERLGRGLQRHMSVTAWVRFSSIGAPRGETVAMKGDLGSMSNPVWALMLSDPAFGPPALPLARITREGAPELFAAGTTTVLPGVWHHVAMTYSDENGLRLYLNGVLEGAAPNANPGALISFHPDADLQTAKIGYGAEASADFSTSGDIDEVRVYNRELTAAQIAALASGSNLAPGSTVSRYRLSKKHIAGSQQVYVGGVRKLPADDYTMTACLDTCEINFNAPLSDSDLVSVSYRYRPSQNS